MSSFRRARIRSVVYAGLIIGLLLIGILPVQADPPSNADGRSDGARPADTTAPKDKVRRRAPRVEGYPPVVAPEERRPGPLPWRGGSIPVDLDLKVAPDAAGDSAADSEPVDDVAPTVAGAAARASTTDARVAQATPGPAGKVALRALVIAIDANDWGVDTWRATLDRVGAAYDVLYSGDQALTAEQLVRADGTGAYNAVLLTNSMQLYQDEAGNFVSGLSADEWNLLWAYERDYGVRQAAIYTSYGSWPEDYCLRSVSEGGVGDTPLISNLTSTGAQVFDYLTSSANIPIVQSWVYRTSIDAAWGGQPLLTAGTDVLGVRSTSPDGRERLALSFTSNQYLLQANLLTYGLFRWASRGLFLGEQRHYLNIDIDDWFNATDEQYPDGTINSDPGFRMRARDAYNLKVRQDDLRARHPLASGLTMNIAYNGAAADLSAGANCYPSGGIDRLTSTSRCLANEFIWLNHTATHPKMNFTDYQTSYDEIADNISIAGQLGLPTDSTVLKTGEYSGLGVYHPDVNNDIDPPTDFGLQASNPDLLQAARDLGVTHLHGNMSFASHRPGCFNCALVHPMENAVQIVPDWPVNIAYFSTTPAEEVYFYNSYYGPNGKFPYWLTDLDYNQIIDVETDVALDHVATGSIYSHTFHIGNVRDYSGGKTLRTDWADALLAKYGSFYSVPILSPGWPDIAATASVWSSHFAALSAGVDAVYDPATDTVTVTAPSDATVIVTGAQAPGADTYGNNVIARLDLSAGMPSTVETKLLP